MKIKKISEIVGTERDVLFTGGNSLRLLLEKDGLGFSFHKTMIPKSKPHHWHYPYHLEACFCIAGHGVITDLASGDKHEILPDTMYVLDNHDDHTFEAFEDTVLISVFNPPIVGGEKHDANGNYPKNTHNNSDKAAEIVKALNGVKNDYDAIDIVQSILNK